MRKPCEMTGDTTNNFVEQNQDAVQESHMLPDTGSIRLRSLMRKEVLRERLTAFLHGAAELTLIDAEAYEIVETLFRRHPEWREHLEAEAEIEAFIEELPDSYERNTVMAAIVAVLHNEHARRSARLN